ncbi:antibiotic biosynthesis monooxygenase [Nonomuraea sp. K274]|uniref:Antibiotic biosynthesis monooxygenase n=1 Tax=Nonomuraea cypriaca TaxID=1187855 RepID=A0A931AJ22_9ACTN|nr:antibiotic biosynthesis monooxygenase [Nonomuraea cypriaca]MBF8191904.1 antibiotic biosynthesis monooxygenase [Nonomuraea cypriaca]
MAPIVPDREVVTLINVFTVAPDNQQQLVDLLIRATEDVMSKQPGYRAAHIHRSLDGTKVANYAQWRSREDVESLAGNPDAAAHMGRVRALATFEPVVYDVVFSHTSAAQGQAASTPDQARKPHIAIPDGLPGVAGLAAVKPGLAAKLGAFTHELMRGGSPLTPGEREVIAAFVSVRNDTYFCAHAHTAAAAQLVDGGTDTVHAVIDDPASAPVSTKLRALLRIADKVRRSGLEVTTDDIDQARAAGADDADIHDAVLVAATFCLYNRYVDGLAAITPDSPAVYDQIGGHLARNGYSPEKAL